MRQHFGDHFSEGKIGRRLALALLVVPLTNTYIFKHLVQYTFGDGMTSILQKMPVIISKKEARENYGVYNSQFKSFQGYFLLKKKTFEEITTTVEKRTKARDAIMAEIKAVMGLDGKGKASGEAAERFCKMNGLDIKKAEFSMKSSVPYVEAETFVFFCTPGRQNKRHSILFDNDGQIRKQLQNA